uniref:CA174 protein n=1 Tax=Malurus cyaneus samueli TaxID=2593467 RepID=A0A8C5X8L5_9PASS
MPRALSLQPSAWNPEPLAHSPQSSARSPQPLAQSLEPSVQCPKPSVRCLEPSALSPEPGALSPLPVPGARPGAPEPRGSTRWRARVLTRPKMAAGGACSSPEAAEEQPAKKMKCEKSSIKSELEGVTCESRNLAAQGETPKTSEGDGGSEDPGDSKIIQQKKDESIPETDEGKQEKDEEESSCGSFDGAASENADRPRRPMFLEYSSGLSDEDSNQPMPVHRFFGDVEDIPAVVLPSMTRSRREARKLHFIAKEDEEEEEEEEEEDVV